MIVAGIDYSITCPCVCFYEEGKEPRFRFITKKKKDAQIFQYGIGIIHNPNILNSDQVLTFKKNANIIVEEIIKHKVKHVFIEGYAFAAKGLVYNIGENGGILKLELARHDIDYTIVPPSKIKKFATDKGNANKEKMLEAFIKETNIDLELYGFKATKNPSSDIVDSYFIAKYGYNEIQQSLSK